MSKTFQIATDLIIVILAVLITFFTGIGIFEFADSMRTYTVSEDSLVYALQDGRYGELVEDYHRNMAADAKTTDTMQECYAIARYYEAAIDYKLALQENDIEAQKITKEKMENSASEMGELSYAKEEIDKILGI